MSLAVLSISSSNCRIHECIVSRVVTRRWSQPTPSRPRQVLDGTDVSQLYMLRHDINQQKEVSDAFWSCQEPQKLDRGAARNASHIVGPITTELWKLTLFNDHFHSFKKSELLHLVSLYYLLLDPCVSLGLWKILRSRIPWRIAAVPNESCASGCSPIALDVTCGQLISASSCPSSRDNWNVAGLGLAFWWCVCPLSIAPVSGMWFCFSSFVLSIGYQFSGDTIC